MTTSETGTVMSPHETQESIRQLETRSGLALTIRPVVPSDEAMIADLLKRVSPDDLRSRYLASVNTASPGLARELVAVDHGQTGTFLAFDGSGNLLAAAMLTCDIDRDTAEVAIVVAADAKHRGIGWALLDFTADEAARRGVQCLQSIESSANQEAIQLERDMGFHVGPYPGDPSLNLITAELWTRQRS